MVRYVDIAEITNKNSKGYGRIGVIFSRSKYYYHLIDIYPLAKKERKTLTRQMRPRPTYYVKKTSVKILDYKKFDNKMRKKVNKALIEGKKWLGYPARKFYMPLSNCLDPLPLA